MNKHSHVFFCNNTFLEKHTTPAKTKSHKYAKSEAQPKKNNTWLGSVFATTQRAAGGGGEALSLTVHEPRNKNKHFVFIFPYNFSTLWLLCRCWALVVVWSLPASSAKFWGLFEGVLGYSMFGWSFFHAILGYFCLFRVIGFCYDVVVQNVIE